MSTYPRVRLPGLPWSPSFMAAYEAALTGPRAAIGGKNPATSRARIPRANAESA
jgi:hypothetical protein